MTPNPYCKVCHPGAIKRRWTREFVLDAMLVWRARYGRRASSYDWSRARDAAAIKPGRLDLGELC